MTFLLAQHISEPFQDLLVEQLDRCSHWPVALLGETQSIETGQVWVVPPESASKWMAGALFGEPGGWAPAHRPDIDSVLSTCC